MELAGLPLGWKDYPKTLGEWVTKGAGLIVSILAVSLGGPFWFDVLQWFMQLRATGVALRATSQKKKLGSVRVRPLSGPDGLHEKAADGAPP
jgi:hypothetical protein